MALVETGKFSRTSQDAALITAFVPISRDANSCGSVLVRFSLVYRSNCFLCIGLKTRTARIALALFDKQNRAVTTGSKTVRDRSKIGTRKPRLTRFNHMKCLHSTFQAGKSLSGANIQAISHTVNCFTSNEKSSLGSNGRTADTIEI